MPGESAINHGSPSKVFLEGKVAEFINGNFSLIFRYGSSLEKNVRPLLEKVNELIYCSFTYFSKSALIFCSHLFKASRLAHLG